MFVCPEGYPYDEGEGSEPEEPQALQEAQRQATLTGDRLYPPVEDRGAEANLVHHPQMERSELRGKVERDRRNILLGMGALQVVLGLNGIVIFKIVTQSRRQVEALLRKPAEVRRSGPQTLPASSVRTGRLAVVDAPNGGLHMGAFGEWMEAAGRWPTMSLSSNYSVGIGITTWKSYETLEATLESYRESGIVSLFDRAIIWFQDKRDQDEELARRYGFEAYGSENRGLAMAMHNLTTALNTDYVVLTENDCAVVEDKEEVRRQLEAALGLLEAGRIDLMRLRHRFHFGEGFRIQKYLDFFPVRDLHPEFVETRKLQDRPAILRTCRGLLRPGKKRWMSGRSVYFEREPDKLFPDVIEKDESGIYIVDSSALNFTTQSILLPREFLYRLVYHVYSHPSSRTSNNWISPERHINKSFWKKGGFKVGIGRGFFTHERVDGSWRKKHRAYDEEAVC